MEMVIRGVKVTCDANIAETEATNYVDKYEKVAEQQGRSLESISIHIDGDFADITYNMSPGPKFDHIRRITGYLVGTTERFNDAKRAEEQDRVKHAVTA